ncbi:hypothetical protein QC761_0037130 [Podospora bellae-mahoneyi]|uniref:Uncharacterized protein n=1 Tax=Podospora bellae-mahoneyi TaxID=2093777 RepID=A0ABR0FPH1_9PEZI|nr:hypothetical protein QC761_0037130 [Podospora bellae-mahoneyi]
MLTIRPRASPRYRDVSAIMHLPFCHYAINILILATSLGADSRVRWQGVKGPGSLVCLGSHVPVNG